MAAKKPSLKFYENKGSPVPGMAAGKQKLLTDADKAKSRREQLRFGKKGTSPQVNSSARKQASGKGVVKRDTLLKKSVRAARDEAASNANEDKNVGTQALESGIGAADTVAEETVHSRYSRKLKQIEKVNKQERHSGKSNLGASSKSAESDFLRSNPISRWRQRAKIRKEYYDAKSTGTAHSARTASTVGGVKSYAQNEF